MKWIHTFGLPEMDDVERREVSNRKSYWWLGSYRRTSALVKHLWVRMLTFVAIVRYNDTHCMYMYKNCTCSSTCSFISQRQDKLYYKSKTGG
mmetsp:Transcript_14303/g.16242  ORF Transcript_14303/g.16242 Transcript_14303/m.16242 type:complete len:92 (-) Transcript_14303:362-637(-)